LLRILLTEPAQEDIRHILSQSAEQFGSAARVRYRSLIETALQNLCKDPYRLGSRELPNRKGQYTYHLKWSRGGKPSVRFPRHVVVYRVVAGDLLLVQRLLHDAMDLPAAIEDSESGQGN
jgi:toxin ParE1/3/4